MSVFRPMRLSSLAAAAALLVACGSDPNPEAIIDAGVPDAEPEKSFADCSDSDQAFVRNAHVALLGYRPMSQAQVNVYSDLMAAVRVRNLGSAEGEGELDAGPPPASVDPRRAIAELLLEDEAYLSRWSEHFMDALQVPRIEDQSQRSCYGDRERIDDGGELAAFVRDNAPIDGGDGKGAFTLLDLMRSSLSLDDLSPVYRAHILAMVSRPIPAANVPRVQAELARREDFGNVFDASYLNRDITCLGCHNSTNSITETPDPSTNRHWDLPGLFEESIYGSANGIAPDRAHSPFRYDGFVADIFFGETGDTKPWDWDLSCGAFFTNGLSDDPADVDGRFASLTGKQTTVYGLEQSLRAGFESIAANGLTIEDDESIADPDAAFAYLVASNIVDGVWAELIGSRLTIANHFPRNKESRDLLLELTEEFIKNGFSLRELLIDVVSSSYFNRVEPAAGCGASAYNIPPVFDPWTIEDDDELRRANSAGDGVIALSARTLLSAAYAALEWRRPFFESFPERPSSVNNCANTFPSCSQLNNACENNGQCCFAEKYWCDYGPSENEPSTRAQRSFLKGIGIFLKHGDRGFRGLDFQARLVFEDRFGGCRKVDPAADFVDTTLGLADETPGTTLGDVVAALKDRIVGQSRVDHTVRDSGVSEKQALESYFDATLETPFADLNDRSSKVRGYCGMLLSTPHFLLGGIAAPDSRYEPILTPEAFSYQTVCNGLTVPASLSEHSIACSEGGLDLL